MVSRSNQFTRWNTQRNSNILQLIHPWLTFPTFILLESNCCYSGFFGKLLLRQSRFFSSIAYTLCNIQNTHRLFLSISHNKKIFK